MENQNTTRDPAVRNIYKQLLDYLNSGKQAAVISGYKGPDTVKTLICEDDLNAWGALNAGEAGLSLSQSGNETVLAECYSPNPRLIVLGGGNIALPLSSFGARLGFQITVFDDRPSFANQARFLDARTVICDSFENMTERLQIGKNDYVVIVTRGHRHDMTCLRGILNGEFPEYAGMIGSRRRVAIVKKQLEDETGAASKLARLHAPIGLPIGAVTPEEIALSILAEIVRCKRLGPSCGGKQRLSKAPCGSFPDMELLEWLTKDRTEKAALITVVSTEGSTPRETGAKMVVTPYGQTIGSIGGGCAEADAVQKARAVIQSGAYHLMDIDMTDSAEDDGMVCGGTMKILIEAI